MRSRAKPNIRCRCSRTCGFPDRTAVRAWQEDVPVRPTARAAANALIFNAIALRRSARWAIRGKDRHRCHPVFIIYSTRENVGA